jgi:hypothetical protein
METSPQAVAKSWRLLLIEVAWAREYHVFYSISSSTARGAARNPILEKLLPSLLCIKAVTVLDEALRVKLVELRERPKARGFRSDLNGRIETALAAGALADVSVLHKVRESRNNVAHEFSERVDWDGLEAAIAGIHSALQQLGFVGDRPVLDVRAERVPKSALVDPRAILGFAYSVSVHAGTTVLADMKWSEEILGSETIETSSLARADHRIRDAVIEAE